MIRRRPRRRRLGVLRRTARAGLAVLGLAVVLAVLPAGLLAIQQRMIWDWPALAVQMLSPQGAVLAALAVGWLVWLLLIRAIVLDLVDAVRHRRHTPRLPMPLHTAIAAAAGGILLAIETARSGTTATAVPPAHTAPIVAADTAAVRPGLDLPGGWLPIPVAAATGAALTLWWTRHRDSYTPGPTHGAHRGDADLAVPTTVVDRLPPADTGNGWSIACVVPDGTQVGLVGPGAADAARGLLIAAVTDTTGGTPTVQLTMAGAAALLGTQVRARDTTRLQITATGDVPRFSTGGRSVVLGPTDGATAWYVAADGTLSAISGTPPIADRLPILDQPTTNGLLTAFGLLTAARPEPPPRAAPTRPAEPRPPLRLDVFGPPVLVRYDQGGERPVPIRRTAAWQILVLLTVHRDGLTVADLKHAVWSDVSQAAADRRFYTTISELRTTLRDAAGQPVLHHADQPATRRRDERRYHLDPAAVTTDLWHFHDLLDTAATTTDPEQRRKHLHTAAQIPPGPIAERWQQPWVVAARERQARHLLDILTELADTEPHPATAITLLHEALRLAPANQAVHRRLLTRHAASGDHEGLRRAATALHKQLTATRTELDPDTVALLTDLGIAHHDAPRPATADTNGRRHDQRTDQRRRIEPRAGR
ncbi:hypothetical protein [Dactylosporangium sp. NPDC051541]|uniref:hypothetical protein n=1 Tax=Dactylosporangium sp. NPDC051541 TaxID=3363977 RepID=UPI0037B8DF25